jgi:putative endonuclease
VVEGARLESVYTPKGYRGFESLTLRVNQEKFFVYILQSMKDFSVYVGQCDDLDRRMSKHFEGFNKYTSSKAPWKLVYFEMKETRREALKREREIKSMKSRQYIQALILNWQKTL